MAWARGDLIDAGAILVVLIVNALVGFGTEWQAHRALDALRRQTLTTARVRRDGRELKVDAIELVPGDVVILNAGDRVPADARLHEAASLRAGESALTGESAPVNKSIEPAPSDAPLAERYSMLYLGTTLTAGRAVALVTATGVNTELGHIGRLVAESPEEATPLEKRMAELGRRLVYIVLAIAAVILVAGWIRGESFWAMVEVSISLAVAAVPEGLPAVTTLVLAIGVLRMARQRAIVRRLPAVETLGSTTIICTDKTGTLTENRMTVREYRLADGRVVELGDGASIGGDELLVRILRAGVLCSEAAFERSADAEISAIGDPTETALLVAADALGVEVPSERAVYPKIAERPFDAATKRMITLHRTGDGSVVAFMKGAPAVVLDASTSFYTTAADGSIVTAPLSDAARNRFLGVNEEMANRALRVLALAEKCFEGETVSAGFGADLEEAGFTFLGLAGMIDPPRREVPEAIEQARAAGIRVVMLTGDQINTARAIARELRLGGDAEQAFHARDIAGASPDRVVEMARCATVFARVSPEDKLRIVEALQRTGEIVAVTGDGVNDAPALKRPDIGVAMGERGTEAAKEAADLILADDNFATIIRAVEGGRTIYANIIKFVHLLFSANFGEVLAIFIAILAGWPLPLLPLQILWVNLVTDVFPALALALEPAAPGVMQHSPRSPRAALLSRQFLVLIGWQGAMLGAITLGCYWWALERYGAGPSARSIALLALINVQLGHFFNCRSRTRSAIEGLFRNWWVWAAVGIVVVLQLMAVYFTPLAHVLGVAAPQPGDWTVALISGVAPIAIVEVTKLIANRGAARGRDVVAIDSRPGSA